MGQKELISEIRDRHRKAEKKRRADVRKMADLAQSVNINKPIPGIEKAQLRLFPEELEECVLGETYTFLEGSKQKWYDLLNLVEEAVTDQGGEAKFNFETGVLSCTMSVAKQQAQAEEKEQAAASESIGFSVEIFASRRWAKDLYKAVLDEDDDEFAALQEVLVTRICRTHGDALTFKKIKDTFLLVKCGSILKGLPQWADRIERQAEEEQAEKEEEDAEDDGDYDKLLQAEYDATKHLVVE